MNENLLGKCGFYCGESACGDLSDRTSRRRAISGNAIGWHLSIQGNN